ncbi:MAG: hypothetical protein A2987_01410 [Omnitrophica bacterium RIFCSPLOWO2_01_FULL_45_10]|nr:MAG: hypothetical protein A2987_01410 [Omnitrophica bacterium RIFCSPLOWO2_01_FULL_45_10]
MNPYPWLIFLVSFLASFLSVPIVRGLALRFKILDQPGPRKMHKVATPLLGGVAVYFGLFAGSLFAFKEISSFLPIFVGGTLILILGAINDARELSASLRFTLQSLIAFSLVMTGFHISFLPEGYWWHTTEAFVTIMWIVGVLNAYNYLDGLDGLAVGSAVINLACFAVILYRTSQHSLALFSIILAVACMGFLPYNMKRTRIFLGEAGSTFLGFMLAGIAVAGNWAEDGAVKLAIPILVLGVPIFDMIFTTTMRIREKKIKTVIEWMRFSGRDHFHHYLVDLGFRPLGAVVFIYFVTLALCISAVMLGNDKAPEALLALAQAFMTFGIIAALIVAAKRRHNDFKH